MLHLSRGKQIGISIFLVHFLIIFALLAHHFISRKLKPARSMVVQTVQLKIPPPVATVAKPSVKPTPAPAPAKKKKETAPAKVIATAPVAAKAVPKPPRAELLVPTLATVVAVAPAPSYGEFLIAYLQSALDLPEYGDVRLKLEIDRFGRLIDCQILEAKSQENSTFLKNALPTLTFPCLNDFDIIETSQTFTITFRNVETH